MSKILFNFISDVFDFKDILNIKDKNDDLFFIYWFIFVVSNKIIMDFLCYEILKIVCLRKEFYD